MNSGLPVSKSIAQRKMICRAMHGEIFRALPDSLYMATLPEDVKVLHNALRELTTQSFPVTIDLRDNGTAMRFLTAYCAQSVGKEVVLCGSKRLSERPVGQLVDALLSLGADIEYLGNVGFPPLKIKGVKLDLTRPVRLDNPLSSQYVSALLLIGAQVETNDSSPYIAMTYKIIEQECDGKKLQKDYQYQTSSDIESNRSTTAQYRPFPDIESDWSAAAFWLERNVLGLPVPDYIREELQQMYAKPSLQGDKAALDIFRQLSRLQGDATLGIDRVFQWNFSSCPDLYPAVAVACYKLGIKTEFTGLERLVYKESNRLQAVEENFCRIENGIKPFSYNDHRIAMAFLAAGYEVDNPECVAKSYPAFLSQLYDVVRVIPTRMPLHNVSGDGEVYQDGESWTVEGGVLTLRQNDEGRGKKHALSAAMRKISSRWVWMSDDDVTLPVDYSSLLMSLSDKYSFIILPLRMTMGHGTLFELLQVLEYDAIQGLTLFSAQHGHAVMCAGAALLVRREVWLSCEEELNHDIPSGDDMFLLEAVKRRGLAIRVLTKPLTYVAPQTTFTALMHQRMRWAGKAPRYTDHDIRLCGVLVVVSNIMAVICPLWLIVKWVADTILIKRYRQAVGAKQITARHWLGTLLLTIIYPWYMLVCLIGGLFKKKW